MKFEQPVFDNAEDKKEIPPSEEINIEDIYKIEDKIEEATKIIFEQKEQLSTKIKDFIAQKEKEGWKIFDYESDNMGNDEINDDKIFLFDPSVDILQWKDAKFAEGKYNSSEDTNRFSEWIDTIDEGKYFSFLRSQINNY